MHEAGKGKRKGDAALFEEVNPLSNLYTPIGNELPHPTSAPSPIHFPRPYHVPVHCPMCSTVRNYKFYFYSLLTPDFFLCLKIGRAGNGGKERETWKRKEKNARHGAGQDRVGGGGVASSRNWVISPLSSTWLTSHRTPLSPSPFLDHVIDYGDYLTPLHKPQMSFENKVKRVRRK